MIRIERMGTSPEDYTCGTVSNSPERHIHAIDELGLGLPAEMVASLAAWLALMDEAGSVMNLTGLSDPQEMAVELVGEALRLRTLGELPEGCRVLDIGSGNGSPVIPLAVACPQASFVAVEARQRRSDFLRLAVARLRLRNLRVVNCRVEKLPEDARGPYELVVSRAFAATAEYIRIASGLLAPGGEIRGMGGDVSEDVIAAATAAGRSAELSCYLHGERQRCIYIIR